MGQGTKKLCRQLGRAMVASPLIYGGLGAAREPGMRHKALERSGLPASPGLVRFNGGAMVVGGVALALGIKPKLAAFGLATSITATTLVGHAFWREEDEAARKNQSIQFYKNAAILGGLLLEIVS
ncbi:DoxX family protein [Ferrimicrobium acidiphilum]|uniref:DoxX family protein n=1 Tax=Ferrimicrobium acidiphilum TaxID=121039 RepID=UPI0023F35BED|nr:DoxX family protein [Ferrimicrobium acidiphilum]